MSLITHNSGMHMAYGAVVSELVKWLVLPLVIGQLVRPLLGKICNQAQKNCQ